MLLHFRADINAVINEGDEEDEEDTALNVTAAWCGGDSTLISFLLEHGAVPHPQPERTLGM